MAQKIKKQDISEEEKNIFLQDLEDDIDESEEYEEYDDEYEEEEEDNDEDSPVKKKKNHSTAIFASIFVFFILIVVLLIFLLTLADTENPVFRAFGIEGYQIKQFLRDLTDKIFMVLVIVLLLSAAIGIFRGYSLPKSKPKKRRASFVFGGVAFGLIFFSVLAWGGAIAFINKFVVNNFSHAQIEILNSPDGYIIAPIDITFSAAEIVKELMYKKQRIKGFRWSKDEGKTYSSSSLNQEYTLQYFSDGVRIISVEVELLSGKVESFSRTFSIDGATFLTTPSRIEQGKTFSLNASYLQKRSGKYFWDFNDDGAYEKKTNSPIIKKKYDSKGEKTVNLRIEGVDGGVKLYSKTFIVYSQGEQMVNAKILLESKKGKTPFKVTLDGSSSYSELDSIEKYKWTIEGSRPIEGDVIDHVFKKPGKYEVLLKVTTGSGKEDSEKIIIEVEKGNSAPVAELRTKPNLERGQSSLVGYIPFSVNFYGGKSTDADENIVQYKWVLEEDGEKVDEFFGEKQEYVFRTPGNYSMRLRVSDAEGALSEKIIKLKVKEPPVIPIVSAFPESGTAPLIVEFNASLSTCRLENCKIISYEWDYDDKTKVIRGGAFASHQFKKPGSYEVGVTAITDTGERVREVLYVTVTDTPLISCFASSRTSGVAPLTVSFDPTRCSKGKITKYQWDFGDGFISSKKKTVHTYTSKGVYPVVLRVFDKDGRVNEMKDVITVE